MSSMIHEKSQNLPSALTEAFGYMQLNSVCPPEVKARILGLRVHGEDDHGGRMTTNWRIGSSGRRNNGPAHKSELPTFRHPVGAQPRYGHRGDTSVSVEVRMMDRIRDTTLK